MKNQESTRITAHIDVTPEHLATAGLVALDAACAREMAARGLGSGVSESVGRYAGVLVARALGGHVDHAHPHGADVITMFDDRVRVRTHLGRRPTRYTRQDFRSLFTEDVKEAIHVHLDVHDMRVLRAIKVTGTHMAAHPTTISVDGDDITSWLVDSASVLESLREAPVPSDAHSLEHLTQDERERVYAIDRIYFEGGNWLDEVKRLKIYPYRQDS